MSEQGRTWSSITIGCRANQADTREVERHLKRSGWRKVALQTPCEMVLINTCTVTGRSDRQCRKTINRGGRTNPNGTVVVMGCFARMRGRYPGCPENVLFIEAHEPSKASVEILEHFGCDVGEDRPLESFLVDATRPPLKVQDGCDNGCAFCTVWLARGRPRSVPVEKVIDDLETLREGGAQEVVLTGINLGTWGKDLGVAGGLVALLEEILPRLPVERVRLSSLEPQHVDGRLLRLLGEWKDRLCPFLHLPLQSAVDRTLQSMGRPYSFGEYAEAVAQAVELVPDICLGADVLCGFPGETRDEFESGLERVGRLPLSYLHVFPFSARPGTAAAGLLHKVPEPEIKKRARLMRELSSKKKEAFRHSQLGSVRLSVLEDRWCRMTRRRIAMTDNYLDVRVGGDNRSRFGLVRVKLDRIQDGILFGSVQD